MTVDRTRLAKALALTASTNDAEALAAIRCANTILDRHGLTWTDLLSDPRRTLAAAPPDYGTKLVALFARRNSLDYARRLFVDAMADRLRENRPPTEAQIHGIRRTYAAVFDGDA